MATLASALPGRQAAGGAAVGMVAVAKLSVVDIACARSLSSDRA